MYKVTETQNKIKEMWQSNSSMDKPKVKYDIAKQLNVTIRYVNKVISSQTVPGNNHTSTSPGTKGKYRLHACYFIIHPFYFGHKFPGIKNPLGTVDGHRYEIHSNKTIHIYQRKKKEWGEDFPASIYDDNINGLQAIATDYWNMVWARLEARLDCHFLKEGYPTIEQARCHIEYINDDGVAKTIILEKGKGIFIHNLEGKAVMTFDMSGNRFNREYIAGGFDNVDNANKAEPYIQSILFQQHYLPHESKELIDKAIIAIDALVKEKAFYNENLVAHVKAIQELGKGVNELRHEIRKKGGLAALDRKWQLKYGEKQRKLGDYE